VRCCCTISCPPYESNEWCCNVKPTPYSPWLSVHAPFWAAAGKKFSICYHPIQGLTDAVQRHSTEWDAVAPFHAIHISPMGDVAMSNQLLTPHVDVSPHHSFLGCCWQKV
jgi:hypothetical protein